MTKDRSARQQGRPRDLGIDARVLQATRELLVEKGFDATNVHSIAKRSGEHASAIYRRWPSRIEIIEEAVFPGFSSVALRPTGDLRRDLRRFIRAELSAFSTPVARAAMPGLMANYQSVGRSGAPEVWLSVSARPQFLDILLAAPEGTVDPSLDPDDVFDFLEGAILARMLVPTIAERRRPVERLVEFTLRLLQPVPADLAL